MKVSIYKKDIPLVTSFSYYLDTLVSLPYAEVTVEDDGFVGKGEIPCAIDINGETSGGSQLLAPLVGDILSSVSVRSVSDIRSVMRELSIRIAFNAATLFGIEQALFDLLAQRDATTLAALLEAKGTSVKTMVTIPYLADTKTYHAKLEQVFSLNPSRIKIKIGADLKRDQEAIAAARSYDRTVPLSVDANQAFPTAKEAALFMEKIKRYDIAWFEQPLPHRASVEQWKELKKQAPMPIMADESVHTVRDLELFAQNGAIDLVNVKLAKCGGIFEAREILAAARAHGIAAMLGSMLEGPLALKYNLAFALSEDFVGHDFSTNYKTRSGEAVFIDAAKLCSTEAVLA